MIRELYLATKPSSVSLSKPDGGRHIHRRADVAVKRVCRYAGLRNIGWHVLRHNADFRIMPNGFFNSGLRLDLSRLESA